MNELPLARWQLTVLTACAVLLGLAGYAALAIASPSAPSALSPLQVAGLIAAAALGLVAGGVRVRSRPRTAVLEPLLLAGLLAAVAFLAASSLAHVGQFLRIPADLVAFSESPFVDDIIKFRLGLPLYGPVEDNNTYPYTPGTQLLTYGIASLVGDPTSIALLRSVQFAYVIVAALVGAATCHQLALGRLRPDEYRYRPLWIGVFGATMLLLVSEPRFNLYTHALHNDGLALLVSMTGFWLVARHHVTAQRWLLVPMALLPAAGFLVKQNQLMWAGVFGLYLLASGTLRWRDLVLYGVGAGLAAAVVIGGSIALWGDAFRYWVFSALGDKQVSVMRSAQHLLDAGMFAAMGLIAAAVLLWRGADRRGAAAWLAWAIVLLLTAYTSGLGFQVNHLGPAVVMAGGWMLVAAVRLWPRTPDEGQGGWRRPVGQAGAAAILILLLAGMGFLREPGRAVPAELDAYIAAIEREFAGVPADRVLMDVGSWIYLRENVLMRDRSGPVSLHVGSNQPTINRAALAATITRIESGQYDRILARELDTPRSAYDYHDRGSGVKAAILEHYRVVRRIPGVSVARWWPRHIIGEVLVLEPR